MGQIHCNSSGINSLISNFFLFYFLHGFLVCVCMTDWLWVTVACGFDNVGAFACCPNLMGNSKHAKHVLWCSFSHAHICIDCCLHAPSESDFMTHAVTDECLFLKSGSGGTVRKVRTPKTRPNSGFLRKRPPRQTYSHGLQVWRGESRFLQFKHTISLIISEYFRVNK